MSFASEAEERLPQLDFGTGAFDHHPRTRLVFGPGSSGRLGALARENGASHVLLVTDPGIVAAGHPAKACASLEAAGVKVTVFKEVEQNPTTATVRRCVEAARLAGIDFLIGLGGGSAMDTAKGCNFLLTNGGEMKDYQGVGKATKPMLPLIAVPTTSGTGSECQSFALIADETTHQKMACGDPKAAARVALLDPALTLSQPRGVTACTGIDAVAHAVESAVTLKRNPVSHMYSREAFGLCALNLPEVLQGPDDLGARGRMLLGAAFAGLAIENSMLGAAHSAANPLTARFGIVHGQAVGMMLPHVVRFNAAEPGTRFLYARLAADAGIAGSHEQDEEAVESLIGFLKGLLSDCGFPATLAKCGVTQSDIPALAVEAAAQWTAQFNPRKAGVEEFAGLYQSALTGR